MNELETQKNLLPLEQNDIKVFQRIIKTKTNIGDMPRVFKQYDIFIGKSE